MAKLASINACTLKKATKIKSKKKYFASLIWYNAIRGDWIHQIKEANFSLKHN